MKIMVGKLLYLSLAFVAILFSFNVKQNINYKASAWYVYKLRTEAWGTGATSDFKNYAIFLSGSGNPVIEQECISSSTYLYLCALFFDPEHDVKNGEILQFDEIAYAAD